MGVPMEGDFAVKFRAGRKVEGTRARPLIIKVPDNKMREAILECPKACK